MSKYLYILLLFVIASCNSKNDIKRFEVFGYAIGDTIDDGVIITEVANSWISYGELIDSRNVKVWLFNKHIEAIIIDSISSKEFESLSIRITELYNISPYYSKDSLYCGLKLKAEEYYWFDSISNDCLALRRSTEANTDSLFSMSFTNEICSNSYREQIFGPEDEGEEIIVVEDED